MACVTSRMFIQTFFLSPTKKKREILTCVHLHDVLHQSLCLVDILANLTDRKHKALLRNTENCGQKIQHCNL